MKKAAIFFTLIFCSLLLLFVCLGSLNVLYANGSITFDMVEADKSKKSKGPTPANSNPYDPTTAQTFSFNLTGLSDNEYYKISASLTRSNFKGYAANFGNNTAYKDLSFLNSDYVDPSGWKWESDTSLSFKRDTTTNAKPGSIVVRCHDWGANGTVTVTIQRKIGIDQMGNDLWENVGEPFTKQVPYDENKNGIADVWEREKNIWVADNAEALAKAAADDEVAPNNQNTNNGDGWSVYDEYRGIAQTDANVTRLDPTQKDVIYTLHTNLQNYDLSQLPDIDKHEFRSVDSSFVYTEYRYQCLY